MAEQTSAPDPGGDSAPPDEHASAPPDEHASAPPDEHASAPPDEHASAPPDERAPALRDGHAPSQTTEPVPALTARTYGELAALISDVPAAPGSLPLAPGSPGAAAGAAPKDLVRIRSDISSVRRDGPWLVPKRMEVRVNLGTVTLDFTEAVISWPSLEIDADIQTGTLILVIAPGILVSTDDLAIYTSTVKVDAPWGPEVPVRFRIDVAGRASISTITARPPLPARRPRRTFWQWLLRRRPEQRALPPGQR